MTCPAPGAVASLPTSGLHAGHGSTGLCTQGKILPFTGIHPTLRREHRGPEGLSAPWGRRAFSQPRSASYWVMQRIFTCVALHSCVVPNLLQAENMIPGSGKLLVQGQ